MARKRAPGTKSWSRGYRMAFGRSDPPGTSPQALVLSPKNKLLTVSVEVNLTHSNRSRALGRIV